MTSSALFAAISAYERQVIEGAIRAQDGRLPDLRMDVAGAGRDGMPKHVVEIHGRFCIGRRRVPL
jgi:hypothetical protein